jgi:hypothetical protein
MAKDFVAVMRQAETVLCTEAGCQGWLCIGEFQWKKYTTKSAQVVGKSFSNP